MLGFILKFLPFVGSLVDPIAKITDKIVQLKIEQANQVTEQARIQSQEDIAVLEAQRAVMIAEAQYNARTNQLIRFLFVIPVGFVIWWLFIWDKVACKWFVAAVDADRVCTTDKLSIEMWWVIYTVIGFYFLQNIARVLKK